MDDDCGNLLPGWLPGWYMKLKMIDLPRVVENSFVSDYQLGREIVW